MGSKSVSVSLLSIQLFVFLFISLFGYQNAIAQKSTTQEPEKQHSFFNLYLGYSPLSVWLLGKTPESQTLLMSVNYNIPIHEYKRDINVYYSAGVVPYVWYNYSKRDRNGDKYKTNGFGLYPVGFHFMKLINEKWSYSAQTAGGIIFMKDVFPTDKSKKMNFTFELSLSMHKRLSDRFGIYFGYKFHHISNAQTGSENPGLDSNFLFLSFSYFNK